MNGPSPFISGHLLKSSELQSMKLHFCLFLSFVNQCKFIKFHGLNNTIYLLMTPKFLSTDQTFPHPYIVTWCFFSALRDLIPTSYSHHFLFLFSLTPQIESISKFGLSPYIPRAPLFSVTVVFTHTSMSSIFCQNYDSFLENTLDLFNLASLCSPHNNQVIFFSKILLFLLIYKKEVRKISVCSYSPPHPPHNGHEHKLQKHLAF